MQRTPKVSVVLCTCNRYACLRQAIDSILYQTFKDLELIIVDDASSHHEVLESIQQYEAEYSNVRVMRHTENLGVSVSRNIGIENARGTYIMLMDDDDISLPNRVKTQYDFLESHPDYAAVACGYSYIDSYGIKRDQYIANLPNRSYDTTSPEEDQLTSPFILGPYTMFRRSALLDIGAYRRWFRDHAEDLDLTLRLQEKYKLGYLSLILYEYRRDVGSKLVSLYTRWFYDLAAYVSAWYRRKGLDDPIDSNPTLEDVVALLACIDVPEDFRLGRLNYAIGFCRTTIASGDYAGVRQMLKVCRYCVRSTDKRAKSRLRKLRLAILVWFFWYRFGWVKQYYNWLKQRL